MIFKNGNVFIDGGFQKKDFAVKDGRFTFCNCEPGETVDISGKGEIIDISGKYVIPGLVDVHTHGSMGADFSDGDYEGLKKMAKYYAKSGVTSFAPAGMWLSTIKR